MRMIKIMGGLAVGLAGIFAIYRLYPSVLFQVMMWQKTFNSELSGSLNAIHSNPQQAGLTLILVSFLYGIFHAVGPGHGKFILTSYLSFEQTKLPQAVKISLVSALLQGLVAVGLVSMIVVAFTLSRTYFNLTLQWVERSSFAIMVLLGLYWCYQGWQSLRVSRQPTFAIRRISSVGLQKNAKILPLVFPNHQHDEHCGCGHKHLPSSQQMQTAHDWKAQAMLILSIGARPCSGAILVLFLAYPLDLYLWGVASALVMAVGTGLTLSAFASLVLLARHQAVKLSRWYLPKSQRKRSVFALKLLIGIALILLGFALLHGSFIEPVVGNPFKK